MKPMGEVAAFVWTLLDLTFTRIIPLFAFIVGHLLLQGFQVLSSIFFFPHAGGTSRRGHRRADASWSVVRDSVHRGDASWSVIRDSVQRGGARRGSSSALDEEGDLSDFDYRFHEIAASRFRSKTSDLQSRHDDAQESSAKIIDTKLGADLETSGASAETTSAGMEEMKPQESEALAGMQSPSTAPEQNNSGPLAEPIVVDSKLAEGGELPPATAESNHSEFSPVKLTPDNGMTQNVSRSKVSRSKRRNAVADLCLKDTTLETIVEEDENEAQNHEEEPPPHRSSPNDVEDERKLAQSRSYDSTVGTKALRTPSTPFTSASPSTPLSTASRARPILSSSSISAKSFSKQRKRIPGVRKLAKVMKSSAASLLD
ncbi:hypothetical protein KP509_37G018700 [Ceratopteris richardii]|nr:hypothetical protein KP509_37G018700 [Ceratopteris richardii]